MKKQIIIFLTLLIGILIALFLNFDMKLNNMVNFSEETSVIIDPSTEGRKLGHNYLEFSIIDYHRLFFQDKPFLLYFYAKNCMSCDAQQKVILNLAAQNKLRFSILQVLLPEEEETLKKNSLSAIYGVTLPNTFVLIDKDSNPIGKYLGNGMPEQLYDFFSKL